jgi:hypothetical protein
LEEEEEEEERRRAIMKTQPPTTLQQNINMTPTNWLKPFEEDTKATTNHYFLSQSFIKTTQTKS